MTPMPNPEWWLEEMQQSAEDALWEQLVRTEWNAPHKEDFLKYSKQAVKSVDPIDEFKVSAGQLTNLRERLIADQTRRASAELNALKATKRDLSPTEIDRRNELESFVRSSGNVVKDIRQQRARQVAFERREALRPAKERQFVPHRSIRDRNAAILGTLEREARHNARLSRVSFARAKALAASRRSQKHYRKGSYAERRRVHQEARERGLFGEECIKAGERGLIRVQVLFAKKHARGHHSAKKFSALGCGDVL